METGYGDNFAAAAASASQSPQIIAVGLNCLAPQHIEVHIHLLRVCMHAVCTCVLCVYVCACCVSAVCALHAVCVRVWYARACIICMYMTAIAALMCTPQKCPVAKSVSSLSV